MKKCSFTGHRVIFDEHYARLDSLLSRAIEYVYSEGCREFYTGGALGFDTMAAKKLIAYRMTHNDVRLIVVVPCENQAEKWSSKAKEVYDFILANADDPHVVETLEGLDYVSFGLSESNRVHPVNVSADWRHMDVVCDGKHYCHVDLKVIGKHNALNALAAIGAAWMMGVPGEAVTAGLSTFHGANRRMQYKGSFNGADVYDDYAHHPDELRATIEAVHTMNYERVVIAFQPHTYTRTQALFDDFVTELRKADHLVLAEIYAARERNTCGISSRDLQERIPGSHYCQTLPEVTEYLRSIAKPGDLILTVGAGDIFCAGEALLK